MIIEIAISLLPVFVFLLALVYLDSFKLVSIRSIIYTILAGSIAAILSYLINSTILNNTDVNITFYARYLAPLIEESLKAAYIIFLLSRKKIGFMVDAAIYGFAVGAGFAFIENIYYLNAVENSNLLIWFVRGFGTAVMHGGTMIIFAIISKNLSDKHFSLKLYHLLPGFLFAVIIHSFFNHFIFSPLIITALQIIILPAVITLVFYRSEKSLKDWMETGMDTEVALLEQINEGKVSDTHVGEYLISLQNNFPGTVVADMLCYIKNHIELAIRAKGLLLMKEAGLPFTIDEDIQSRFDELKYLEKSIGTTGKLAISPILHTNTADLWQIQLLQNTK